MDEVTSPRGSDGFDLEDERESLAHEIAAAARGLARLADLSLIVEGDSAELVNSELNQLADRLFRWAVSVGTNLFRPALVEAVDAQHEAFVHWNELQARVRSRHPQQRHQMKVNSDNKGERS